MIEGTVSLKCSRCNHCEVCQWVDLKMNGCDWFEEEQRTGWIPVSERLPEVLDGTNGEYSDDVLICVADNEQIIISTGFYGYYPNSNLSQGWWSMWAYGCHKLDSKYKVIAWMSLPAPFEPQESEVSE